MSLVLHCASLNSMRGGHKRHHITSPLVPYIQCLPASYLIAGGRKRHSQTRASPRGDHAGHPQSRALVDGIMLAASDTAPKRRGLPFEASTNGFGVA